MQDAITPQYPMGRIPSSLDEHDYRMTAAFTFKDTLTSTWRRKMVWRPRGVTNQGASTDGVNGCTGFSIANLGALTPIINMREFAAGAAIYKLARQIERTYPQDVGATTRGSLKAAQQLGLIKNYYFARSLDEIEFYIRSRGPVVFASDWYYDMFKPGKGFYLSPTGQNMGGHQYILYGVDARDRKARVWYVESSWDVTWADNGTARMDDSVAQYLYQSRGECAGVTEIRSLKGGQLN